MSQLSRRSIGLVRSDFGVLAGEAEALGGHGDLRPMHSSAGRDTNSRVSGKRMKSEFPPARRIVHHMLSPQDHRHKRMMLLVLAHVAY